MSLTGRTVTSSAILLGWVLGLMGLDTGQLRAADRIYEGIEIIEARPLFKGSTQEWTPFLVALENRRETSRTVQVQLMTQIGNRNYPMNWNVELSPGAVKRQVIPCYRGRTRRGSIYGTLRILENGVRITPDLDPSLSFSLSSFGSVGGRNQLPMNVLLVTPEPRYDTSDIEDHWRSELRRTGITELNFDTITAEELPVAPEVYRAVHRLLLVSTSRGDVSAGQSRAVERAVRAGCTAWVLPGKAGEGNDWIFRDSTAMPTAETIEVDRDPVNIFLVEEGGEEPGATVSLISDDSGAEYPGVIEYRFGQGVWRRVTTSSVVSITLRESTKRRGTVVDLHPIPLQDDAGWGRGRVRTSGTGHWHEPLDDMLREGVPLVSVFVILVAYLLIVGPGLFWFLKRKGRLILLLWVQPVVVALFLGGIYLLGWVHFGVVARGIETLVVHQPLGSRWGNGYSVHTQYSATEGTRDLATADGTLPVLLATETTRTMSWLVDARQGNRLLGFYFPTWSYTHFITQGPVELGNAPEVIVTPDENKLIIINHLPFSIRDPVFGTRTFTGEIKPGEETEYALLEAELDVPAWDILKENPDWYQVRKRILSRFLDTQDARSCILVEFDPAELRDVPFSVTGDKRLRRGVLIVPVEGP